MTNHLRLSGPYARLLLRRIMRRIPHFTLWNLLMKILKDDTVIVDPQELLGCTFLMDTQEDGQRFCDRIVECISDHESNVCHSDNHIKFQISINEDKYKKIITYNELMDFIEKNQENNAIVW
jgi:hypothetical protein